MCCVRKTKGLSLYPLVIAGATATGKSAVAQFIAEQTGAAIVSADSMLVYRGMDIGTAKPTATERRRVRYIGLDCVAPNEAFSVGDWLECVRRGLATLPDNTPIVVAGGTGLYIKALFKGLDSAASNPEVRQHFYAVFERDGLAALQREVTARGLDVPPGDSSNPRRLIRALERMASGCENATAALPPVFKVDTADPSSPYPPIFCLNMPRDILAERIRRRIETMFAEGLVEEAARLFPRASSTSSGAIGYAEALAFARGELSRDEAVERIASRTRQLAKRQYTWFRHQLPVTWVEVPHGASAEVVAQLILERCPPVLLTD